MNDAAFVDWPGDIHAVFGELGVRQVAYVPDAGHSRLIDLCHADDSMRAVPLTREEEGVGLLGGAWLGGERGVLLMQSSGVGNCLNAIASVSVACALPLFMLVTMRGGPSEGNPWQVPMGRATAALLAAMDVQVDVVDEAAGVRNTVRASGTQVFASRQRRAVLLAQTLVGVKVFE